MLKLSTFYWRSHGNAVFSMAVTIVTQFVAKLMQSRGKTCWKAWLAC